MTIDTVIQLGKEATTGTYSFFIGNWIWWAILVVFILIAVFLSEQTGTSLVAFWIFGHFAFTMINMEMVESENLEQWKNEVVIPYIETLEVERHEIVYIKIDPELSSRTAGGLFFTYSTPMYLTPLTVSFKSDGIETVTDWHETRMELTSEDVPYIEFIRLKQDLGNNVKKGLYNKKVFLPESYKFTEIK